MSKGYKTTEFWVTVVTALVNIANSSGLLPFQIPVETMITITSGVAAYVLSRGVAKITK